MFRLKFIPFLLIFAILSVGCSKSNEVDISAITETCKKWEEAKCKGECEDGSFGKCYHDPRYKSAASKNASWQCYAIHVGSTCTPCESRFMLNFQGAFQPVYCIDFHKAINKKNLQCDDCLKVIEILPEHDFK